MADPIIIPEAPIKVGDSIQFGDKFYKAEQHFSQGKDMIGQGYTHIMYSNKGAFGMVEV